MDALIRVRSSEFNEDIFNKIKALLKSFGDAEITIAVTDTLNTSRKESKEEYWNRISQSVSDIENGKGVSFTVEELNKLSLEYASQ